MELTLEKCNLKIDIVLKKVIYIYFSFKKSNLYLLSYFYNHQNISNNKGKIMTNCEIYNYNLWLLMRLIRFFCIVIQQNGQEKQTDVILIITILR